MKIEFSGVVIKIDNMEQACRTILELSLQLQKKGKKCIGPRKGEAPPRRLVPSVLCSAWGWDSWDKIWEAASYSGVWSKNLKLTTTKWHHIFLQDCSWCTSCPFGSETFILLFSVTSSVFKSQLKFHFLCGSFLH